MSRRQLQQALDKEQARRSDLEQELGLLKEDLSSRSVQEPLKASSPLTALQAIINRPGELLSILTIIGLTGYAFLWFSYSRFYQHFGLRPEDVGLNYATILVRAAIGWAAMVLLLLTPVLVVEIITPTGPDRSSYRVSGWLIYVLFGANLIWLFFVGLVGGDPPLPIVIVTIVLFAMIILWVLTSRVQKGWGILWDWAFMHIQQNPMMLRRVIGILGLALVFVSLYLPRYVGDRLANSVESGGETFSLLDLHVLPVNVQWTGTPPPNLTAKPKFVYFGEADQNLILFEAVDKRVYRIPSQEAIIWTSR